MNPAIEILKERGFFSAASDLEALNSELDSNKITFYVGCDPTGKSLHIGHMVPYFAAHYLQELGHNPIALVGGGTAMIGDPSGKTEMRKMLSKAEIDENKKNIKNQLKSVIDFDNKDKTKGKAIMLDNADWILNLNYIDFLREIGKHFSVNKMLTYESYKKRLERGLSFIEFNYQLLQSYDFYMLYKNHNCHLQIGGDDQWGNMVNTAFENESVWVWTKKLPCDTPIDFRNCNDYYRNLYDEKTYEEYIESILNEIKSNIDNILSTGLPLDISTIDID